MRGGGSVCRTIATRIPVAIGYGSSAVVESIRAAHVPVVNTRYLADEHAVPLDDMAERLAAMADAGTLEGQGRLWWLSLESDLDG